MVCSTFQQVAACHSGQENVRKADSATFPFVHNLFCFVKSLAGNKNKGFMVSCQTYLADRLRLGDTTKSCRPSLGCQVVLPMLLCH